MRNKIQKDGCVIDIVDHCETMLTEYGRYNVPSCQEVEEHKQQYDVDVVLNVDHDKVRELFNVDWSNEMIEEELSGCIIIESALVN